MKIITIVGARPQFIKSIPVSKELSKNSISEIIIHTGQHYDYNMSEVFFEQFSAPKPKYMLNINGLSHGAMTGQMLEQIEKILLLEKPEYVIVYGDTNSTLAGALATSKLNIKLIHIEAGLRSFNLKMPEEINRIVTDRLSNLLFCPTEDSVKNLMNEGFKYFNCSVINSGDVMMDAAVMFSNFVIKPSFLFPDDYILCTIHRQENTDYSENLKSIFTSLNEIAQEKIIVLPLHPRTRKKLFENGFILKLNENILIINPVSYFEMLYLIKHSSLIITDSGGLQKEAFFFKKVCLTVRNETEWTELVVNGFNFICGAKTDLILSQYNIASKVTPNFEIDLYGKGAASKRIVQELLK